MEITIDQYLTNIRKAIEGLPIEVDAIIEENKDRILDLNRDNQLFDKGIDSDGKRVTNKETGSPFYSPFTILEKRATGLPTNRITLFQTGRFYDGFDILKRRDNISIFSRDSKSAELVDRYGNIFGLTTENERIFNYEILLPEINEYVNRFL